MVRLSSDSWPCSRRQVSDASVELGSMPAARRSVLARLAGSRGADDPVAVSFERLSQGGQGCGLAGAGHADDELQAPAGGGRGHHGGVLADGE